MYKYTVTYLCPVMYVQMYNSDIYVHLYNSHISRIFLAYFIQRASNSKLQQEAYFL